MNQFELKKGYLNLIQTGRRFLGRHSHINWALADQTMVSGVNFLTGILLARYLGIEEYGRFVLGWMSVLFVNSFHHTAINSPMMSIGPKQPNEEISTYYGATIIQQAVFSCAIFFLLFAGVHLSGALFPEWRVEDLALPLATAAFAFQFQDFLRRYFFVRGRGGTAFALSTIRYLGQIALLISLFTFFPDSMNTTNVLWAIAIVTIVAAICGAFYVEQVVFDRHILKKITKRHWDFSKWLNASALMHWTTGNLFVIAAGILLGTAAVGALKAAHNIMGITNILFQGLENIVPARAASHLHNNGTKDMSKYLWKVAAFGGLATATIGIIASVAPEFWLHLFFGSEYLGNGYLVQWYAIIFVTMFLSLPLSAGIQAMEKSQVIFRANAWRTLFSLLSFYPFTLYLGLPGVMAGILTVNLIYLLTMWIGFQRELKKVNPLAKHPNKEIPKIMLKEKHIEKDAPTVLTAFFRHLEKNNIKYCVMGRPDGLPENITSDIDIVINQDSLDTIYDHINEFSKLNSVNIAQIINYEPFAYYFILTWKDQFGRPLYLHPDICSSVIWNGKTLLSSSELLSSCVPAADMEGNRKGFFVAAPEKEFIYYLLKKIDKRSLDNDHGKYLSSVWRKAPVECNTEIERFWPKDKAEILRRAANLDNWEEVRDKMSFLRKPIFPKIPLNSPGFGLNEIFRILKRILYPTGLQVVFLGPDGSGKSSVIERVIQDLAPAFRRTASLHFRPVFKRKNCDDRPIIDPHNQIPRSQLTSIAKIFYLLFHYLRGWLLDIRPKTARSTLVLFDRYFHDILVDPKRYRYGGPLGLVRWVGKIIPKPDLWILLDAPSEVMHGRKQEVPYNETERQRKEYLKLVQNINNGFVVDAGKELDDVVADVNAIILDFLAQRTEKRREL